MQESLTRDWGLIKKAALDSGAQLRRTQSAPLSLEGLEAEISTRNLLSQRDEMRARILRKFHLLHGL